MDSLYRENENVWTLKYLYVIYFIKLKALFIYWKYQSMFKDIGTLVSVSILLAIIIGVLIQLY